MILNKKYFFSHFLKNNIFIILVWFLISTFYLLFAYRTFILHIYPSPPFFYDEGDSLADWFNTALWSNRIDKYTTWLSVYPPFAHFVTFLLSHIIGIPDESYMLGWRQFSNQSKLSIIFHIFLWFSILTPITLNFNKSVLCSFRSFKYYLKSHFIFKVLVLFSYSSLFTFERGNLLSICFVLYLLSFRYIFLGNKYIPYIIIGAISSIKPYILLFSNYFFRIKNFILTLIVSTFTTLISLIFYNSDGVNYIFNNLSHFTSYNSLNDILSKTIHSFSFYSYSYYPILVDYGLSGTTTQFDYNFFLNLFSILAKAIFLLTTVLLLSIFLKIYFSKGINFKSIYLSNLFNYKHTCVFYYLLPSLALNFSFVSLSSGSGAYVVMFYLAALLVLEEQTLLISKNPVLLLFFFLAFCIFDFPSLSSNSYNCGSSVLKTIDYVPLITQITGIKFLCTGKFVGFFSLSRPISFLIFNFLLFYKIGLRIFNLNILKQ